MVLVSDDYQFSIMMFYQHTGNFILQNSDGTLQLMTSKLVRAYIAVIPDSDCFFSFYNDQNSAFARRVTRESLYSIINTLESRGVCSSSDLKLLSLLNLMPHFVIVNRRTFDSNLIRIGTDAQTELAKEISKQRKTYGDRFPF